MSNPKIIFFGTPEFAVPCLTALVEGGFDVVGVVTQPDKPAGRGMKLQACPIKTKAQELGLKIFDIKNLPFCDSAESQNGLLADVGVCVAYGKIIPQSILDHFPKGILNIHPSLLPKYRGPSPVQTAILNGDVETGVTIMLLDKEMDHGPILKNSKLQIPNSIASGELLEQLFQIGTDLLIKILPKYLAGEIIPREQDHSKATFTKMLTREDGKIDWNKPAREIERMVRAYDPWPGTWTMWSECATLSVDQKNTQCLASQSLRLKILKATFANSRELANKLVMQCNPGALILEQVQPEGKKPMSGQEFLRGYSKIP